MIRPKGRCLFAGTHGFSEIPRRLSEPTEQTHKPQKEPNLAGSRQTIKNHRGPSRSSSAH